MAGVTANGWPGLPDLLARHSIHAPEPGQRDWQQEDGVLKATISQHEAWRHFHRTDTEWGWQHNKQYLNESIIPFSTTPRFAGPSTRARKRSKSWAGITDWHRALLASQRIRQEMVGPVYMLTACYVSGDPVLDPPALMKTYLPGKPEFQGMSEVAGLSVRIAPAWSTWLQVAYWLKEVTGHAREDWMVIYTINPGHKHALAVKIRNPFYSSFYCPLVALFGGDLMPCLQLVRLQQATKQKEFIRQIQADRQAAAERRAGWFNNGVNREYLLSATGPGGFVPGCWENCQRDQRSAACDEWWVGTRASITHVNFGDFDAPHERVWQWAGRALSAAVLTA